MKDRKKLRRLKKQELRAMLKARKEGNTILQDHLGLNLKKYEE